MEFLRELCVCVFLVGTKSRITCKLFMLNFWPKHWYNWVHCVWLRFPMLDTFGGTDNYSKYCICVIFIQFLSNVWQFKCSALRAEGNEQSISIDKWVVGLLSRDGAVGSQRNFEEVKSKFFSMHQVSSTCLLKFILKNVKKTEHFHEIPAEIQRFFEFPWRMAMTSPSISALDAMDDSTWTNLVDSSHSEQFHRWLSVQSPTMPDSPAWMYHTTFALIDDAKNRSQWPPMGMCRQSMQYQQLSNDRQRHTWFSLYSNTFRIHPIRLRPFSCPCRCGGIRRILEPTRGVLGEMFESENWKVAMRTELEASKAIESCTSYWWKKRECTVYGAMLL